MSLYVPMANKYGAFSGIVVGTLIVMVWPSLNPLVMDFELPPMIPGFLLSGVAIYLVSRLTKSKVAISAAS